MSVTHDMTRSEREQNKLTVVGAKTLNDNDTSGKDRWIVRGPPWERKVVKIKIKVNRQNEKDVQKQMYIDQLSF